MARASWYARALVAEALAGRKEKQREKRRESQTEIVQLDKDLSTIKNGNDGQEIRESELTQDPLHERDTY